MNEYKIYSKEELIKELEKFLFTTIDDDDEIIFAHELAMSGNWQTHDPEILKWKNREGTIAHYLAYYNRNWMTQEFEILNLKDTWDVTVAHVLAYYNPNWSTNNKKILDLKDVKGITVKEILNNRSSLL